MVSLRNWEMLAKSSLPINNAQVDAVIASDTHPNPGASVATVFTNSSGLWEINGLADGSLYDVRVSFGGDTRWYKANTRHQIGHLYDDTTPDPNRNLLPNGSMDGWKRIGAGAVSIPIGDPGVENVADGWVGYVGSGDSATSQREGTVIATNSLNSLKCTYNRSGGQAVHYRDLPAPIWQQLKGKQIAVSAQVHQVTGTSKLGVFIDDGIGTMSGTITDTVGSFATISATRMISASATRVRIGVTTTRVDTGSKVFYIDNVMADLGSAAPTFAPELIESSDLITYVLVDDTISPAADADTLARVLSQLANRVKGITGLASWRTALVDSLATLRTAVNTAQNTANTGVTNAATAQGTANTGVTNAATAQATANAGVANAATAQATANARAQKTNGVYSGAGSGGRTISAGFTPSCVEIFFTTGTAWGNGLIVNGTNQAFAIGFSGAAIFQNLSIGTQIVSGGFQVKGAGIGDWSDVSGTTYTWAAYG